MKENVNAEQSYATISNLKNGSFFQISNLAIDDFYQAFKQILMDCFDEDHRYDMQKVVFSSLHDFIDFGDFRRRGCFYVYFPCFRDVKVFRRKGHQARAI